MVKKSRLRIFLAMMLVLTMLIPEFGSVFAEVVTTEGYAFVSFDDPKANTKMKIAEAGTTQITTVIEGKKGRVMSATDATQQMIYCDVDDSFLNNLPEDTPIAVEIEYYDAVGGGSVGLAYDSYNPDLKYYSGNVIYNDAPILYLEGTETWRTHTWILGDMRMSNRGNNVTDFRIGTYDVYMGNSKTDVAVSSVKVYVGEFENPTDLFVDSDYIGNVFSEKDKEIVLNINVKNKEYDDLKGNYTVNIKDKLTGLDVYSESFELETKARNSNVYKMSFPNPGRYTIYTVDVNASEWKLKSPDNIKTHHFGSECSVAMAVEKGEQNLMHGTMAQVIKDGRGHPDKVYTWQREDVGWSVIEQEKGVYKLPDGMLETYKEMTDAGIKLMFVCLGRNPHYDNNTPASDEAVEGFANYCAFMAKSLEGVCDYFEIWNEWNISTFNPSREPPETYAKLCKASYKAIKKVRPDATVIGVSTALIDIPWTKSVFEAGAYDYMDMVTELRNCSSSINKEVDIGIL